MNLQALPLRARLFLNTKKWINTFYHDRPVPAEVEARLTELRDREDELHNPFDLEAYIEELSTEYAELLADIIEGKNLVDEASAMSDGEENTGEK